MIRLFVLLCITTLCSLLGVGAAVPAAPPAPDAAATPISMENEFTRVVVNAGPDEAGRFSIRTTGGDPLNLIGPVITCPNKQSDFEKAMKYPVWIQTTDNRWFKAQSAGNSPGLAERLRSRLGW